MARTTYYRVLDCTDDTPQIIAGGNCRLRNPELANHKHARRETMNTDTISDTLQVHTYDYAPELIRVSRDPHAHTQIITDSHTQTPAVEIELEFSVFDTEQILTIWAEQPMGSGLSPLTLPTHWLPPLLKRLQERMPAVGASDDEWREAIEAL